MSLVTLAEAKAHLRIDSDADDAWLTTWMEVTSDAVLAWLKDDWRAYVLATDGEGEDLYDSSGDGVIELDTSGNPAEVLPRVKGAVLLELAQQYRFRDGSEAYSVPAHWGHGHVLGAGATALLAASRKSSLR